MKRVLLFVACLSVAFMGTAFTQFAITVDAEKDAWYNSLTGPNDGYIHIPPEALATPFTAPEDEHDLSASCWLAWDKDYLYFYTEIWDEIVLVNNSTTYQNDAVEFKIDPDPNIVTTVVPPNCRLSSLGENDAEVVAGVDYPGKDNGLGDIYESVEGLDYARKMTDLGYNLEWRLPWSVIHSGDEYATVEAGSTFGLAINIMDNDDIARTTIIQWSAGMHDNVWSNAQLHGTVTFLADNKLKMEPVNTAGGPDPLSDPAWYVPAGTGTEERTVDGPSRFALSQNYPNPFNPGTTIDFSLPKASRVHLSVYDVMGREVANLLNETKAAGNHRVAFNGAKLESGMYFYRLTAENKTLTRKLTLLK